MEWRLNDEETVNTSTGDSSNCRLYFTLIYLILVTGLIVINRVWSHVRSRSESASVLKFSMPVPGLQVTTFGRNEQWSGPGSSARIHAGTRLNEDMNGFQVAILRGNMPQRLNMCTTKSIPKSYIRPQNASPQHTHTHNPITGFCLNRHKKMQNKNKAMATGPAILEQATEVCTCVHLPFLCQHQLLWVPELQSHTHWLQPWRVEFPAIRL